MILSVHGPSNLPLIDDSVKLLHDLVSLVACMACKKTWNNGVFDDSVCRCSHYYHLANGHWCHRWDASELTCVPSLDIEFLLANIRGIVACKCIL